MKDIACPVYAEKKANAASFPDSSLERQHTNDYNRKPVGRYDRPPGGNLLYGKGTSFYLHDPGRRILYGAEEKIHHQGYF